MYSSIHPTTGDQGRCVHEPQCTESRYTAHSAPPLLQCDVSYGLNGIFCFARVPLKRTLGLQTNKTGVVEYDEVDNDSGVIDEDPLGNDDGGWMFDGNPSEVEVDEDDNVEVEVGGLDSGLEVGALDSGLEVWALESEFEDWALDGAGGSASGPGARVDCIRPMTPATFPVLAPNPLFKKDGLKVTSDPFQTDTARATAAAQNFIKERKAHPNLGYFPHPNSPAYNLQTDIRAKATNTPIFGAGKTDKNWYAKKKKGGFRLQTEEFEEEQQAHEKKKAKITKVPAADKFLIGTILTYVDHETVYLAETMRAVASHLTFHVRNLRPRPGAFQTSRLRDLRMGWGKQNNSFCKRGA